MEGRITRRASATAAAASSTKDIGSLNTTASPSAATPLPELPTTTTGEGRGRSSGRARRGTGRPRGRPRGSTRRVSRNESRHILEGLGAMDPDDDDVHESGGDEAAEVHSQDVENNSQTQTQAQATTRTEEQDGGSSGSNKGIATGDIAQLWQPTHDNQASARTDDRGDSGITDGDSRLSVGHVYEEMAELPFISPSLPPTFVPRAVDPLSDESEPRTTTSLSTSSAAAKPKKHFLDEELYNKLSIGGSARIAEVFHQQHAILRNKSASTTVRVDSTSGESALKKQKLTPATSKVSSLTTTNEKGAQARTQSDTNQDAASSTSITSIGQKSYDLADLVARANSYGPELNSALRNLEAAPKPTPVATQQSEQTELLPLMPLPTRFYHPCILSHDNRSMLTREEHQRSIMYETLIRKRSELPPTDKALWTELQAKIEEERQQVRQWNASIVRSRISNYFNPAIRDALEIKFSLARARVREDYPQNYFFQKTIGLRRPGPPPGTKEPILARAVPKEVLQDTRGTKLTSAQRRGGLLYRTGQVCAVSLTKPIWPTDVNGVPFEKTIEVDDRYWRSSTTSSALPEQPVPGTTKTGRDNRRFSFPVKRPIVAVSNDPLAEQFAKEQNVNIAIGASSMVALAKILPSLASEWEIPVKVVLEPNEEGNMQKRVYIDKPLIPKRITKLGITRLFYDGVCKKLSLIGSSSADVGILSEHASKNEVSASSEPVNPEGSPHAAVEINRTVADSAPVSASEAESSTHKEPTTLEKTVDKEEGGEGTLGSQTESAGVPSCHSLEYTLWTFGELKILIRNRIHGYINNTDSTRPPRQVVLKTVLDYAPDIGLSESSKSTKAGWWMATWIRNDRLVALARVDVSRNQFVRYTGLAQPTTEDPENPFKGVFSDLPAIAVEDTGVLKDRDQEIQEWIKPNMRLIHIILGTLTSLAPGQYILGHKAGDVNANVYQAQTDSDGSAKLTAGTRIYDLHTAHQFSPLLVSDQHIEGESKAGSMVEDDPVLRWTGTPDQITDTFPYDDQEPTTAKSKARPRNQPNKGANKNNSKSKSNKKKQSNQSRPS